MVDPLSYFSFQPLLTAVACAILSIKEPLLLIRERERVAHVAAIGFLSRYLSGPLPYVRRHITVSKMC